MKVLTIKQPFATLIAEGIKEYEFRTWNTHYRGELLIHAGKGIDRKAMKKYEEYHFTYPTGCIIAKVNVTDSIRVDETFRNVLMKKNPFVYKSIINDTLWNGYGFQLENVQKIEPIFMNGKLSLWDYEGTVHIL